MITRLAVAGLTIVIGLFVAVLVIIAVGLFFTGQPAPVGVGVAMIVLGAVGLWALVAELRFGARAEHLGRVLEAEGDLPLETLPTRPSGRVDPEQAETLFESYSDAVKENPESWRHWYRLGLVYDAATDRRHARWAIRQAIRREKTAADG